MQLLFIGALMLVAYVAWDYKFNPYGLNSDYKRRKLCMLNDGTVIHVVTVYNKTTKFETIRAFIEARNCVIADEAAIQELTETHIELLDINAQYIFCYSDDGKTKPCELNIEPDASKKHFKRFTFKDLSNEEDIRYAKILTHSSARQKKPNQAVRLAA